MPAKISIDALALKTDNYGMSMFVPWPAMPARNGRRSKRGARTRRDGNGAVMAAGVRAPAAGHGIASALRNKFGVQIGRESLDTALAAVARLFDAAEWRFRS